MLKASTRLGAVAALALLSLAACTVNNPAPQPAVVQTTPAPQQPVVVQPTTPAPGSVVVTPQ